MKLYTLTQDPVQRHIMTVYPFIHKAVSLGVSLPLLSLLFAFLSFFFSETRLILRLQTSCKSSRHTVPHFRVIWAEATLPAPCACDVPCPFPLLNGRKKVCLSRRFFVGVSQHFCNWLQLVCAFRISKSNEKSQN